MLYAEQYVGVEKVFRLDLGDGFDDVDHPITGAQWRIIAHENADGSTPRHIGRARVRLARDRRHARRDRDCAGRGHAGRPRSRPRRP